MSCNCNKPKGFQQDHIHPGSGITPVEGYGHQMVPHHAPQGYHGAYQGHPHQHMPQQGYGVPSNQFQGGAPTGMIPHSHHPGQMQMSPMGQQQMMPQQAPTPYGHQQFSMGSPSMPPINQQQGMQPMPYMGQMPEHMHPMHPIHGMHPMQGTQQPMQQQQPMQPVQPGFPIPENETGAGGYPHANEMPQNLTHGYMPIDDDDAD